MNRKTRLSYLIESELEKAEIVIALKTITDKLQKMAEDLSKIEADDIMPMQDSLKAAFGPQLSEQFTTTSNAKIRELVTAVSSAKDAISNEVSRLENVVNGKSSNDMAMPEPEMKPELPVSDENEEGENLDLGLGGEETGTEPLGNDEKMNAAGRARKESAKIRGNRLNEYAMGEHRVDAFSKLDHRAGILGYEIERKIEDGRFNGEERRELLKILDHLASCATDQRHWGDPDAKVDACLSFAARNGKVDTRLPEVREIVSAMKKLSHLIALKHDGMMESANLDGKILKEFRVVLTETKNPSKAVKLVAEKFSVDVSDVVSIIREFKMKPVSKSKKGMFKGVSKEELRKKLASVKKRMKSHEEKNEKVPAALRKEFSEITFALRAKNDWGKANESVVKEFDMAPVSKEKRGMFAGKTQEELKSELVNVKNEMKTYEDKGKKVPHSLRTKFSELTFALRAKHNWGKVPESASEVKKKVAEKVEPKFDSANHWYDLVDNDTKKIVKKDATPNEERAKKMARDFDSGKPLEEQQPVPPKTPADLRADKLAKAQEKAKQVAELGASKVQPTGGSLKQPPMPLKPGMKPPADVKTDREQQVPGQVRPTVGNYVPAYRDPIGHTRNQPDQQPQSTPVGQAPKKAPSTEVKIPGRPLKQPPNTNIPPVSLMSSATPFPKPKFSNLIGVSPNASVVESKENDKRENDPCWDNYKMVGMKKKNGKEVPNCVPVKKKK